MRGFALLLVRELRRRLPAHLVSLGLALVTLLVPSFLGRASGAHAAEVRGAVAVGLALLWSLALAFIEGLGFLAGDLREGRLAFDFRLPIASLAIWAGRLVAAAASVASAAILILGPTAATGADLAWGLQGLLELVLGNSGLALHSPQVIVSILLLAVVLALDLVGLAIASRKAWLGVDLASAIVFKSLAYLAIRPLWRAGAEAEAGFLIVVAIAGGLLALLVATARQLAAGRTEPDRAHRTFSVTFALVALSTVGALSAWSAWYRTPGPRDLLESELNASPLTADLVWIAGRARHRGELVHAFLLEPRTGRYLHLSEAHPGLGHSRARVSLDRSRVAWRTSERRSTRSWASRVRFADLARDFATPRESGIEWDGIPFAWALSPDGSHVASVWRNGSDDGSLRLRLEALESGGLLKSLTIQHCGSPGAMVFLDGKMILYGCGWPSTTSNRLLGYGLLIDLESGETKAHGRIPYPDRPIDSAFASAPHRWFAPPAARWSRKTAARGGSTSRANPLSRFRPLRRWTPRASWPRRDFWRTESWSSAGSTPEAACWRSTTRRASSCARSRANSGGPRSSASPTTLSSPERTSYPRLIVSWTRRCTGSPRALPRSSRESATSALSRRAPPPRRPRSS